MLSFTPFPVMCTENLLLRRMHHNDAGDLFEMRKDHRMNVHTDTIPDESIDETHEYIDKMNKGVDNNKWIIWAIEHKQSKKVIGSISIWNIDALRGSAELGYGIIPEYQGRGLMKEALLKVINYVFSVMGLELLEAYTEESNTSSAKLLESCDFIVADRVDDQGYINDRVYHMLVYRLENNKINV